MTSAPADDAKGLVEHFEGTLGPIGYEWSVDPDGVKMPFQIVRFTGGSDADSVGYSTLGLSRRVLPSPTSHLHIRHELLMLAPEALKPDHVASILLQVGKMVIGMERALLRGDVIGPAGALVPGTDLTALYVTMPTYFPDEFATYSDDDGAVVIAWLVPITDSEADYVSSHGWDAFEDKLVEQDPDLVDFHRSAIAL
ncbi:MAG: suppressor of fused domain protein [Microbacterium sp.]|uniref:suppressor of fused domain protein n=1 Tax=Microbacterium sp. TaxID=51671 RepID=UPI001DEBECF1|nr:suppressor of fused domain protein [Microbacterium sp.]MBW8761509.1 suppressor of fused domain protein [Microbacterium sp.]